MKIETLRAIGSRLFEGLKRVEPGGVAIARGAAGDKTYPIDKLAEDIILGGLEASGEPLTVISEEAGILNLKGGGETVLIDPVDGSRNAVSGIPFYCTSIAVAQGDRLRDTVLSYIINLVNGEEFWAEREGGAFRNGKPIASQSDDVLYLAAYEASSPKKDIAEILPLLQEARRTRCFGATALSLSYLATGAASVFAIPSLSRSFDFAGGWLIVKEAGGVVTDIEGGDIGHVELGLKRASSVLASGNKALHEKALRLLGRK